ncbi:hypothetical protein C1H46_022356 [Malus baccata]|uniref:polynucleotide adenylyltransferase n=1 Tax=Malus baccata TaxID=106549 RepID=A0A540LZV6_MALBA|nr:hypothetical protein C1H46_022356 [Malus baccata]
MVSSEGLSAPLSPLQAAARQYGVTKPISTAGPTEVDIQRTLELEKFLDEAGLYESKEEVAKREEVLQRIGQDDSLDMQLYLLLKSFPWNKGHGFGFDVFLIKGHAFRYISLMRSAINIVKDWVKQLTRLRGYTDQMVEDANALIFTFGSYRLGVHGPGADIDTLCVGPSYINREVTIDGKQEDFFFVLHNILAKMEEVTELQPVPDAHVPVMKFKFDGISIDLLYASISLLVVPEDLDISDVSLLYNIDEPTVRSLNGCRVADQILKLVPNVEEVELNKAQWCALFEPYSFFESYKNYLQVDIVAADVDDLRAWKGWEVELNKAQWCALFEPYSFFESYKNYLQVDIVAADVDDLRAWKGWVESRLRQLTLMIERDTLGMLQCHPYPHEYFDANKQCAHSAFFMGLQRKQGEKVQGQQFDIRGTVDEFRHSINMYVFWKPGMEIYVSHVRRRQLPPYVYPDGCKRPQPSRVIAHQQANDGEVCGSGSSERHLKRKDLDGVEVNQDTTPQKRQSTSPPPHDSVSPVIISHNASSACPEPSDKGFSVEVVESNKRTLSGEMEPEYASNSSTITHVSSKGSCDDAGFGLVAGICEGNTRNVDGSSVGSNNPGYLQGDVCGADSKGLSDNGCINGNLQQNGSREALEKVNAAFGMVLNSSEGVNSEQITGLRHVY